MSAPIPPNPCLIAILLVVKSRAGPRFVFHYPLNVGEDVSQSYKAVHDAGQETADISSSDDDLIFSSDEDETLLDGRRWDHTDAQAQRSYKRSRFQEEDEGDSPSSQIEGNGRYGEQSRSKKPAWESVLGFSTDGLGTLLCPLRTFHKRRFEMTLDQLVFVGWPVFVRDDGAWRKMREKRRKKDGVDNSSEDKTGDVLEEGIEHPKRTDLELNEDLEETSGHDTALDEPGSNAITEEVPPQDEKTTATGKRKDSMTMFNVIFVMSPPALEHHLRVKQMYDNVVKKFSRALKWEQARSDYVWKESKQILKLKEKAKESSMLCWLCLPSLTTDTSLQRHRSPLYGVKFSLNQAWQKPSPLCIRASPDHPSLKSACPRHSVCHYRSPSRPPHLSSQHRQSRKCQASGSPPPHRSPTTRPQKPPTSPATLPFFSSTTKPPY